MFVSEPDPHPPSQINKEARAAVVPKRARCFPLPACSLMTKASCCSCLLRPLLCGSIVDRAPLVYSWTAWGKTFWTATSLSPHSLRISTVCVHQRKRVRVCVSIYTQLWALCSLIGPRTATGLSGNDRHCSSICSSSHCLLTEHNLRHRVSLLQTFWVLGPFICLTGFVHPYLVSASWFWVGVQQGKNIFCAWQLASAELRRGILFNRKNFWVGYSWTYGKSFF